MPRPAAPPTPQPSTEICSKGDVSGAIQLDNFALPPAAIAPASSNGRNSSRSTSTTSNASDSSYHPMSPPSTSHSSKPSASSSSRKRAIAAAPATEADGGYTLPPPPTRSRKIIQMKPKGQGEQQVAQSQSKDSSASTATTTGNGKAAATAAATTTAAAASGTGGGRKKGNGSTAAGRKIARKTAHSLIERRRRSKMNEEFGVLKNMIPACAGHEMHKLAILQASIEYMRYLEKCVSDLKASHFQTAGSTKSPRASPHDSLGNSPPFSVPIDQQPITVSSDDEDEDMSDAVSPTTIPKTLQPSPALHHHHHSANNSPAMYPADRRSSYAVYSAHNSPAILPSDPRHYSITSSIRSTVTSPNINPSPSILPSPIYTAQPPPFSAPSGSGARFSLTSPALRPLDDGPKDVEREREDHEATAALLMLNSDRRSWTGRALGVKDLLSS